MVSAKVSTMLVFFVWVLRNASKEIKKLKHQKMLWGMRGEALLALQRQDSKDLPALWQWQNWMELPQHRLSWEEREKTEREKAADVKVQSPSSFITIFYLLHNYILPGCLLSKADRGVGQSHSFSLGLKFFMKLKWRIWARLSDNKVVCHSR